MENKSSLIVALILFVLISVALWQFYSLAWGAVIQSSFLLSSVDVAMGG